MFFDRLVFTNMFDKFFLQLQKTQNMHKTHEIKRGHSLLIKERSSNRILIFKHIFIRTCFQYLANATSPTGYEPFFLVTRYARFSLLLRSFNSRKSVFRQREIPVGGIPVSSAAHDWKRLFETSTEAEEKGVAQEFPRRRKNGTIEELIALLTTLRNCAVKYRRRWNISLSTATRNFPRSCGFEAFIAKSSLSLSLSLSILDI